MDSTRIFDSSNGSELDAVEFHFQHGVGFQLVVALEGWVETDDTLRLNGRHAAQTFLAFPI
jgi:hypothetical protein